ncbi:OmpP1/FadL family transporter [Thiohalophilus thiocyanatoxydans]|uniref:Long-chain fatty acid transport protein n=1 Tax=Thiohalophilus thiocyanatoxydans TaxID=381308 RepID=A0A4R8IV96_9GAMM|nr:outer membrane protein transport protein [Thiohalophilus thiocyanatoxydans]TDY01687.1 long-chain fatty acid transport protein [Thiohalophilus thiocyanatoxydans]
MKTTNKRLLATAVAAALALPTAAFATNGYFSHGYGTTNKGLGGAGVALPQDSLAAATNPAGMAFIGERMDVGAALFSPNPRGYTATDASTTAGCQGGQCAFTLGENGSGQTLESEDDVFIIPHFGYNWQLDNNSTLGLSVYGNGGMNTEYKGGQANHNDGTNNNTVNSDGAFGGGTAGVDLEQLFVALTYAQKYSDTGAWGITPILAYQRFEAKGLNKFGGSSSDSDNLTDNGTDTSSGFGVKLGISDEVAPGLTLGASYQSEMDMSEFDDYKGLFAEQGDFDIPATWTLGLAYDMGDSGTVLFDVQEIMYGDIASISNPISNLTVDGNLLGSDDGGGFGWQDITVYKLGYQWATSADWTWRVGYNHGDQPIPNTEVLFNILAPGVMEDHFTFGFTKSTGADSEFNFAAMYAPENSVTGENALNSNQDITIEMTQWEMEASWAWKF